MSAGLLKHLLNAQMNTRMETVDATCRSSAASRSGKHRHLAEECLYVVEARYDRIRTATSRSPTLCVEAQAEIKRFDWEAAT